MKRIPEQGDKQDKGDKPCDFDHNGECLICDSWPSDCAFNRLFSGNFQHETLEELLVMFQKFLTPDEVKLHRIEGVLPDVNGPG